MVGWSQGVDPHDPPPGGTGGERGGAFDVKSPVSFGALPVQLKPNPSGRLHGPVASDLVLIPR